MKRQRVLSMVLLTLISFTLVSLTACFYSKVPEATSTSQTPSPKALKPTAPAATSFQPQRVASTESKDTNALEGFPSNSKKIGLTTSDRSSLGRVSSVAAPSKESIQQQMERLAKALFFHNVPTKMRAGDSYIIEAGATNQFTKELRNQLQGQGEVIIREDVRYDPKGIDIQLKTDPNDFEVKELSVGKRPPIVNGKSTIWRWKVTPLKQGKRNLTLLSVITVDMPGLQQPIVREYTLYKEVVNVLVNPTYSIQQFVVNEWQPLLISLLALLTGIYTWWKALQPKRGKAEAQYRSHEG